MKRIFLFILTTLLFISPSVSAEVWTIAIDPGHGGKDPGAVGRNLHIYEKNVTLSLARELKALLDKDPRFRAVLTRKGDYYISVPERSEIARKNKANYLISIHADSSATPNLRGASVWVLSNRRANSEMGQWLEDHEKQSELLGGAGTVLDNHNEKYLNQTVLDLQFGHSQRVGYELGRTILHNFAKITTLSRNTPQHASLGVLRSPDIPSVLVETGFLSNPEEEAKLSTVAYRRRVAHIIYQGLLDYYRRNANADTNTSGQSISSNTRDSSIRHKVKSGETLDALAKKYNVKATDIQKLNKLKRKTLRIGETLKIPDNGKSSTKGEEKTDKQNVTPDIKDSGIRHKVSSGETLSGLAQKYNVKAADILELNKLKRQTLHVGETLKVPDNGKNNIKSEEKTNKGNATSNIQDSGVRHKVKSGETLGGLAQKYGVKTADILELNKLKRQTLHVGESIKIPSNGKNVAKTEDNAPKNTNKETKPSKDMPKYHVIKKDQTLYAVSREYGIPVNTLLKLNPKLKDGKVITGQRIQLRE